MIHDLVRNDDRVCKPTEAVLEGKKGILEVQNLSAWYGDTLAIKNISMRIAMFAGMKTLLAQRLTSHPSSKSLR